MAQTTPTTTPEETRPVGRLDSYFKITERGSTVWTEVRGGLVTFFAMSYIVVLNPFIIGTVADGTGNTLAGGDFTKIAADLGPDGRATFGDLEVGVEASDGTRLLGGRGGGGLRHGAQSARSDGR